MSSMGVKIMVVDDSALSRRMMRRILEDAGYVVIEEADGATALTLYPVQKPAIVMLDLIMTGMYGLQVLLAVRGIDPEARVIIASADLQRATQNEVKEAGAAGFVIKPFSAPDVLRTVEKVLSDGSSWS